MEKTEFVKLLNEDLESEFRSIVQYVQHIATVSGPEYQSTIDELFDRAEEEVGGGEDLVGRELR